MPTIVVLNGRNRGEWYTLTETPMVFGRDESLLAEILDPTVSRRHMEVRYEPSDDRHYAVDLGSRNGVDINGEKINRFKALTDGDLIQIGYTLLAFTGQEFADDKHAQTYIDRLATAHQGRIEHLDEAEQEKESKGLGGWFMRRKN